MSEKVKVINEDPRIVQIARMQDSTKYGMIFENLTGKEIKILREALNIEM